MTQVRECEAGASSSGAASFLERVGASEGSPLPCPRLLVVLAHPDDEVLALGGRLGRFGQSRFVTVTDGAPKDGEDARHHGFASLSAYRAGRRAELLAALGDAGLREEVLVAFAAVVPDQTASQHLVSLTLALVALLQQTAPQAVLTHPYEGGHPDHDACAFAAHAAVHLVRSTGVVPVPMILEAPFYHAGEHGGMVTGAFLDGASSPIGKDCWLTAEERERKRRRLAFFASQQATLQQFGLELERFRIAPAYNFKEPAHAGRLFYEQFPWGMSGARFRELVCAAEEELFAAHGVADAVARVGPSR